MKWLSAVALVCGGLFVMAIVGTFSGAALTSTAQAGPLIFGPSKEALRDIPPHALALYEANGSSSGFDWTYLAAVGKVETNHCRSNLPGVHSGSNGAGAEGCMQFLAGTWAKYGAGGSPYTLDDSIPAAARYLVASGMLSDPHGALLAYNHAEWYVTDVMNWAAKYRGNPIDGAGGVGGYVNPFPTSRFGPARTDQGIDYISIGRQPVVAIGDGIITFSSYSSGWPGGSCIIEQLTSGDHTGLFIYTCEHLTALHRAGPRAGRVRAGQQIATALPGYPWLETGFAAGPTNDQALIPYNGAPNGTPMPGGQMMTRWLTELGAQTLQHFGPGPDRP